MLLLHHVKKMSLPNDDKKVSSGEWKLERLERSISKLLTAYDNKLICMDTCSFEDLEKLASLLESEELLKFKLNTEKNDGLKLRIMKLLLDISNYKPRTIGFLTKERMLELTTGNNGERLVTKYNLRNLFKKWYPNVFVKSEINYNPSLLSLFSFPTSKEIVFQKQRFNEDSIFIFLSIGLILGYIIGRS